MSDSPFGPTANLYYAYVIAIYKHDLAAPTLIEAMHNLPERSLSVTLKNLLYKFFSFEWKLPCSSTSVNLFIIFSLGILTLLKVKAALSTPFYPIFKPMSVICTPGISLRFLSLIGTRKADTPSFLPLTIV